MQTFLGVDAGGSHTRAVLVSAEGEVLGIGRAGPGNFQTGPFERACAEVGDAVRRTMEQAFAAHDTAGSPEFEVVSAFIGSAGLEGPGDADLGRRLIGNSATPTRLRLDTDILAAWAGAFAGAPGMVLSAGTGSICLGVTESGRRVRVGGWGPVFGDEGSAYAIARRGIKESLAAADGRGPFTSLLRELFDLAGLEPHLESAVSEKGGPALTNWLYAPDRDQAGIARFAPIVEAEARGGDQVALQILERAGHELVALASAAVGQWSGDDRPIRLATNGSVLRRGGLVRESFLAELATEHVPVVVENPRFPPEVGAALLAIEDSGLERSTELLRNLSESLAKVNAAGSEV